jgi:hypothetical protein
VKTTIRNFLLVLTATIAIAGCFGTYQYQPDVSQGRQTNGTQWWQSQQSVNVLGDQVINQSISEEIDQPDRLSNGRERNHPDEDQF